MKDFADFDNVDGAFPDAVAQNATGSGTTDGTPITEDVLNDIWGFFQALLNAASATPSGDCEADGDSQLLDAINTIRNALTTDGATQYKYFSGCEFLSDQPYTNGWQRVIIEATGTTYAYISAVANSGRAALPIHNDEWKTLTDIYIHVFAGKASRTGADRFKFELSKQALGAKALTILATEYESGSGCADTIHIDLGEGITFTDEPLTLIAVAGNPYNDSFADAIYTVKLVGTRAKAVQREVVIP
jgi:hypothetical protein